MAEMVVCEVSEDDWWVGASLEDCVLDYIGCTGGAWGVYEDAHVLSDADLDRLMVSDPDTGERCTFREQLAHEIARGGEFPRAFATADW